VCTQGMLLLDLAWVGGPDGEEQMWFDLKLECSLARKLGPHQCRCSFERLKLAA